MKTFKVSLFEQTLRQEMFSPSVGDDEGSSVSIGGPTVMPVFQEKLENCQLINDKDAYFKCRVLGNPKPNVSNREPNVSNPKPKA